MCINMALGTWDRDVDCGTLGDSTWPGDRAVCWVHQFWHRGLLQLLRTSSLVIFLLTISGCLAGLWVNIMSGLSLGYMHRG